MRDKTLRELLKVAVQIAEKAADPTGFVALSALAREVQADVQFRPLLVEGVAAQPKAKDGRWLILIDNETHRISEEMWTKESPNQPLGSRVRNTVAHELAHALGPRCEAITDGSGKSLKEIAAILERETEQLSPALLIPPVALETLIKAREDVLSIEELVSARDRLGVSSRVFIKRFELLAFEAKSALRYHPRLNNIIIGSGEWISSKSVELHPMPFRGVQGLVPEFVAQLRDQKKVALRDFFPDTDFYLNGGPHIASKTSSWVGTGAQPRAEQATIELIVELTPRKAGVSFLWIARSEESKS